MISHYSEGISAKRKKRIVVLVQEFPQISETYIKVEIEHLLLTHEVEVVALNPGNYPYHNRHKHILINQSNQHNVIAYFREFAPDVLHGHYLHMTPVLSDLSEALGVPYTVRNHSFDVLGASPDVLNNVARLVARDNCLGMLTFPFSVPGLVARGFPAHKVHPCFPVVDVERFRHAGPNGAAIMNVGAALPKKNMEDYIRLSGRMPEKTFNLYALGYDVAALLVCNDRLKGRVNFIPPRQPEDMPAEYKRHEWLVYTASLSVPLVGWPLAVAEAQAAGVGVCVQRVRPDLAEYVGEAGYLFDTVDEVAEIIRNPFPAEKRRLGFELAKRSDIRTHLHQLQVLWPA